MNEKARWESCAAPWTATAARLSDAADRFNLPLIEAAGVIEGETVLDVASGAGEPALSLARQIGPTGRLVATDLVPRMLTGLARRAGKAGETLALAAADMTALPFAPACFDRVTCRFGVMFAPDPVGALHEMGRVLRPGGRAAIMVWGGLAENTLFYVLEQAAAEAGIGSEGAASSRFRFAAEGSLAAALDAAGFVEVAERALVFERVPEIAGEPPFWQAQSRLSCADRLGAATPEQRDSFESALHRRFGALARDGRVRLRFHARIGIGTAP